MKNPAGTKPLTQLHFVVDTILRGCPLCLLSYTKGAVDDEIIHKKHCSRVPPGREWRKEEGKEAVKANVLIIESPVVLETNKGATIGRIISVPGGATSKIGAKLDTLLKTINMTLSAPALTPDMLEVSKAYLFLAPSSFSSRERIVGCIIAQPITTAMNVMPAPELNTETMAILKSILAFIAIPHPSLHLLESLACSSPRYTEDKAFLHYFSKRRLETLYMAANLTYLKVRWYFFNLQNVDAKSCQAGGREAFAYTKKLNDNP